jgi:nicotinamidase-related amidase
MTKPWDGVIPVEDEASFGVGIGELLQPMEVGERPALVDMTRAFVDSAYPTGWSQTGYPTVAANSRLLNAARNARIPVFYTKERPESAPAPSLAEKGKWKSRVLQQETPADLPPGDVIVESLTPVDGEVVINKGKRPSAFFATPLYSLLTFHNIDTTIITGMTTSGCVRATVMDAFQQNFFVVIPHECCADRSQISHKVSLFDMHMKYADVVEMDETLDYLSRVSPNPSS